MPEVGKLQLEIRTQAIKLLPGRNLTEASKQVKACHVFTGTEQIGVMRKALNKIYGSRNKEGFPLGKHMRFVPNIADNSIPTTMTTRSRVKALMSKQRKFLKNTEVASTHTMRGLDYMVPHIGYTLRQILMNLRSPEDATKGLFVSIDERAWNDQTQFVFHKDLEQEARTTIPLLSIILEVHFGPRVWEWFTDDAKEQTEGFYWDTVNGCVRSDEEAMTKEILEDWSDDSELESDEEPDDENIKMVINFQMNGQPMKNQYGDTGSVKTFRDECDVNSKGAYSEESAGPEPSAFTKNVARSPEELSIDADGTQTTSTLTDIDQDLENQFKSLVTSDPGKLAELIMASPKLKSLLESKHAEGKKHQEAVASPNEGVGGTS